MNESIDHASQLERLIPPEIVDDRFSEALTRVAAAPGVRYILDIGASTGEGSTAALVAGALRNPARPQIHCFEVSRSRFEQLRARYSQHDFVHCHRASTISLDRFPTPEELADFCRRPRPLRRRRSLRTLTRWLGQDLDYLLANDLSANGIRDLKKELGIARFDAVVIDGSEFAGKAELEDVYGATYLLLDDILTFKNYDNYRRLRNDPRYHLVQKSTWLRNGYAIFQSTGD